MLIIVYIGSGLFFNGQIRFLLESRILVKKNPIRIRNRACKALQVYALNSTETFLLGQILHIFLGQPVVYVYAGERSNAGLLIRFRILISRKTGSDCIKFSLDFFCNIKANSFSYTYVHLVNKYQKKSSILEEC